jgi:hypothetical protein
MANTRSDWSVFPHVGLYAYNAATIKQHWQRLHAGDQEPLPNRPDVLAAWVLFHNGAFQEAAESGLSAGGDGITVAHKATCAQANHLERRETVRLDLFLGVTQRADAQTLDQPHNPNAWYWQAYALGRYSQHISAAKALAQGLGTRVRKALEMTLRLCPTHADAHIALAAFHAEVIDKVGALIGGMTYGAKKHISLQHYDTAQALHPYSAAVMLEYANGLLMLEGEAARNRATALYEQAAAIQPLDALGHLERDAARAMLASDS